jgi:hypothetical protein
MKIKLDTDEYFDLLDTLKEWGGKSLWSITELLANVPYNRESIITITVEVDEQ